MQRVEEAPVYQNFVGGAWMDSESRELFEVVNPANGSLALKAQRSTEGDVRQAIQAARNAFEKSGWASDPSIRAKAMLEIAELLATEGQKIPRVLTLESGQLSRGAEGQVRRAIDTLRFYAGLSSVLYGRATSASANSIDFTLREPLGVAGIIVPWNGPINLLTRSLAPILAAGNTAIVKPASYTPGCTAEFMKIVEKCKSLPKGVVNMVSGPGPVVGSELARNSDVDLIHFTGETEIGKEIARSACNNLKKVSLELGGKSPNIIYGDGNFEEAVKNAIKGASFQSAGQVCFAGTRILVNEEIHDKFIARMKEILPRMKVGSGLDKDVEVGPVVSESQVRRIMNYIEDGKKNAVLVTGGNRMREGDLSKGCFIQPTLFDRVPGDSKIWREEIFGPVLSVASYSSLEEAAAMANDTIFGLAAIIWSSDINRALLLAKKVKAGMVWINSFGGNILPMEMGGYKQSGVGRHYGLEGLLECTQLKHVAISLRGES